MKEFVKEIKRIEEGDAWRDDDEVGGAGGETPPPPRDPCAVASG